MKKLLLISMLIGAMPLSMMAQDDDLYFVPSKKKVETTGSSVRNTAERPTYYAGSNRDIDEYNRRGKFRSSYQTIGTDSLGNDIIEFHEGTGIYPDTVFVDSMWMAKNGYNDFDNDFTYSRRMSRWDDYYGWYDPWFYGHWGWRPLGYYSWYDPWYYGPYGWYSSWYDPWYYGYYGWGYPYGWGRYGWGYPYYYGWYGHYWGGYPHHGYAYHRGGYDRGHTGTLGYYDRSNYGNRGQINRSGNNNGTYTRKGTTYGSGNKGLGSRRPTTTSTTRSSSNNSSSSYNSHSSGNSNFGGNRSYGNSGYSGGSSSFGGSRSSGGGSFGGGSRSGGGGGHTGGRR